MFDFLSRVDNLPLWATEFAREMRHEGGTAIVVNGLGEFAFAIDADPDTGVIDMFAGPRGEEPARFPTRVVPLGAGRTAYTFTMFQTPAACPTSSSTPSTPACSASSTTCAAVLG